MTKEGRDSMRGVNMQSEKSGKKERATPKKR